MFDFDLLKRLCNTDGISGDEDRVRELIINEIKDFADEIKTDSLGNLIVFRRGKSRAECRLMLSAHMDEVGFMVTDITNDGYLKFDEVGGIDRRCALGKQVTVGDNELNGIIGVKPVHLTKGDESKNIPEYRDMYIDIGAESREEVLKYVTCGDSVCFLPNFEESERRIKSKAIDDRFGCCVLIDMIKSELLYDMYFVFAVQEEVGLRGAKTAAYGVDPDFALVIEATTAADIPEVDESNQVCRLGEGAVISVMDKGTIYDKQMVKAAFKCAAELNVKAQYKRAVAGGNDAGVIHQSRSGVRTLTVSLPCRYLHAPSSTADKSDCQALELLVSELANTIASGAINSKESAL